MNFEVKFESLLKQVSQGLYLLADEPPKNTATMRIYLITASILLSAALSPLLANVIIIQKDADVSVYISKNTYQEIKPHWEPVNQSDTVHLLESEKFIQIFYTLDSEPLNSQSTIYVDEFDDTLRVDILVENIIEGTKVRMLIDQCVSFYDYQKFVQDSPYNHLQRMFGVNYETKLVEVSKESILSTLEGFSAGYRTDCLQENEGLDYASATEQLINYRLLTVLMSTLVDANNVGVREVPFEERYEKIQYVAEHYAYLLRKPYYGKFHAAYLDVLAKIHYMNRHDLPYIQNVVLHNNEDRLRINPYPIIAYEQINQDSLAEYMVASGIVEIADIFRSDPEYVRKDIINFFNLFPGSRYSELLKGLLE